MYGPFGEDASDYGCYIAPKRRARSIDQEHRNQNARYHAQAEYNKGGFTAAFWARPKKTIQKKKTPPVAHAA